VDRLQDYRSYSLLPHFTDIGELCVLTAVVALFAGWVSTSSERLSYAWHADRFGVLHGVAANVLACHGFDRAPRPSGRHSLGQRRDDARVQRAMARIGNHETPRRVADALRSLAALLRSPQNAETNRQHTVEALARADNFEALSRFEIEMLPRQTHLPDLSPHRAYWPVPLFVATQRAARARCRCTGSCLARRLVRCERLTRRPRAAHSRQLYKIQRPLNPGRLHKRPFSKLSIETEHVATSAQYPDRTTRALAS